MNFKIALGLFLTLLTLLLGITFLLISIDSENVKIENYKIKIINNDNNLIKLSTKLDSGCDLYASYDLMNNKITIEKKKYNHYIFNLGLGAKEITKYNVLIKELNKENINIEIINPNLKTTLTIDELAFTNENYSLEFLALLSILKNVADEESIFIFSEKALKLIYNQDYWDLASKNSSKEKETDSRKYFLAKVINGKVHIYKERPLTYNEVITYLKYDEKNSIYSESEEDSRKVCESISPINKVVGEIDKIFEKGNDYYWHFHPLKSNNNSDRLKNHCWYGSPYYEN